MITNRIYLVLAGIVALGAALGTAGYIGYVKGESAGTQACQRSQISELQAFITTTESLTAAAHSASAAMGELVNLKQSADAQSTRELRDALKTTTHIRVDCVFPDSVMHQLDAARDRAAAAATGGVNRLLPSASGTDR